MQDRNLIWTGGLGSAVAAVCCFTPVLVLALGALGLSAWLAWTDWVLVPALAVFLAILSYGLIRHRRRLRAGCAPDEAGEGAR